MLMFYNNDSVCRKLIQVKSQGKCYSSLMFSSGPLKYYNGSFFVKEKTYKIIHSGMHTQVDHSVVLSVLWGWTGGEFRACRDCKTPALSPSSAMFLMFHSQKPGVNNNRLIIIII